MLTLTLALWLHAAQTSAFDLKTRSYRVDQYSLAIQLADDGKFEATETISLTLSSAAPIELDAFRLHVTAVDDAAGKPIKFERRDDDAARTGTLTIASQGMPVGKPTKVAIHYSGAAGTVQEGFFTTTADPPSNERYFFTHFEPTFARRFYPCDDQPSRKATFEVAVETSAHNRVLSNGELIEDVPTGPGRHRVRWRQSKPMSTYLFALAIGAFEDVEVTSQVPAKIHVVPGAAVRAKFSAESTARALSAEAEFLKTPYPWNKFDQVGAPHFFWGGMENTGLVIYREARLLLPVADDQIDRGTASSVIAHEMAHQWFGDWVTCARWTDTWLNEGFATFLAWQVEPQLLPGDYASLQRIAETTIRYFHQENTPHSHPLVAEDSSPEEMFDGVSYVKGANVLWMLHFWLGDEAFREGLRRYLNAHALGVSDSRGFFAAMAEGQPKGSLDAFEDGWLHARGYPVVTPVTRWANGTLHVELAQRPNHSDEKHTFAFKLPIVFHRRAAPAFDDRRVVIIESARTTLDVTLPAEPEWIDWDEGFNALAQIDGVSEDDWIVASRRDPDPAWRMLAAIELARPLVDGGTPSKAALKALAHVIASDPSLQVRAQTLHRLSRPAQATLPSELAKAIEATARLAAPVGGDAFGTAYARQYALPAAGRLRPAPAKLLLAGLSDEHTPYDALEGFAIGVARLGTPEATRALRKALPIQRRRGYPYFRSVVQAFGALESPAAFSALEEVVAQIPGDNEAMNAIVTALQDNTARRSPEAARFVQGFVLSNTSFGDDMKSRVLRILDDVRTQQARAVFEAVAQGASSERLRKMAAQSAASFTGASL